MAKQCAVEYNYLGSTGLKVSNLCLGAGTFGTWDVVPMPGQCDEAKAHAILDRYVELGGNFIDTADIYSTGTSEKIIGTWLKKQKREKIVIATKCGHSLNPNDPNKGILTRSHILNSVDNSLKRLQTDYIDLYQMHIPDLCTPLEETLSALNDLVHMGKIRYIGVSNWLGWQLQKAAQLCKSNGWEPVVTLQPEYNLLSRGIEFELGSVCQTEGIGVIPFSPLKSGFLTGKYQRNQKTFDLNTRIGFITETKRSNFFFLEYDRLDTEQNWNILETMEVIAKHHGKTMAQVALRWLIQKQIVCSVIIGAKTLKQLEDNMGAGTGWELTEEQMKQLDEVSTIANPPYPYNLMFHTQIRKLNTK